MGTATRRVGEDGCLHLRGLHGSSVRRLAALDVTSDKIGITAVLVSGGHRLRLGNGRAPARTPGGHWGHCGLSHPVVSPALKPSTRKGRSNCAAERAAYDGAGERVVPSVRLRTVFGPFVRK